MTKGKRQIISLLMIFAMILVILCCSFYVAAESRHCCVGKNCLICYQINVCESALKQLSLVLCILASSAVGMCTLWKVISAFSDSVPSSNLVSFKVKLSD